MKTKVSKPLPIGLLRAPHFLKPVHYSHIAELTFRFYAHIVACPKVMKPLMCKHMWFHDFCPLESLKNALDRNLLSAKDEYHNISAVPPCVHGTTMLLSGYQHIHGNSRMPSRCRILCDSSHLTAPSAVHLTTCFLPDSQHHRFSV